MSEGTYPECVHNVMGDCPDCAMTQEGLKYADRMAEADTLVELAFSMSLDEFTRLKVADRDTILFALMRQQAGSMKALEMKVLDLEQRARDLMSPEGLEQAKKKVFEALGLGGDMGMFGGLFS